MRKIWDIHGGIHPPENKTQSLQSPITALPLPSQLILPLSQHIGAPATPIVSVGDAVLKGDCIATAEGFVSVPVHAPSSGKIIAIEDRLIPHPSGLADTCIIIETDGKDQWKSLQSRADITTIEKNELLSIIRNKGIAGMGGAGFPSSVKLNTPEDIKIDTLIINATECEPYITADHALMREHSKEIVAGIAILAKLVSPQTVLIGIEDNKKDVVEKLRSELAAHDFSSLTGISTDVDVVVFPTKYPSGGEKQLIQILTGREVPTGGLPSQVGIVCQNIGTTLAIHDAVLKDKPLISRITTVTGNAVTKPGNYEVLLGTPIEDLLTNSGYNATLNNRLVMGGPMMGFALTDITVPVVKTTNCILAPTQNELATPPNAQACIRCGMCAEVCPASLLPQQLYWFSQGKELEKLEAHNLADCIECGACSYVCPSHIPLVQYYRASKAEIRQRNTDMKNAEHAKLRFEARQTRLERLENEKIAARKARQAKAAANTKGKGTSNPKAATIASALERVNAKKNQITTAMTEQHQDAAQTTENNLNQDDPVARALAKRNAQVQQDAADPHAKYVRVVESATTRLTKARGRLVKAEETNDNNIDAFKNAVIKAEQKLNEANAALTALNLNEEDN